ncbi:MAG: hypothetical protein PHU36_08705, partial [Syntrophomonadaceae bacterium]|nr:hypothetical protein [Syntrophomonadaceae bacterium]
FYPVWNCMKNKREMQLAMAGIKPRHFFIVQIKLANYTNKFFMLRNGGEKNRTIKRRVRLFP